MIAVTVDIDWSPDDVVAPLLEEFENLGIPVTFMCTDPATDRTGKSGNLSGMIGARHEIGVHPNFMNRADYDAVWDSALAAYPQATGFRPHNGMTGWPIVDGAQRRGLRYEILCVQAQDAMSPGLLNWGTLRTFPVLTTDYWDSAYARGNGCDWEIARIFSADLLRAPDKLVVAGFHPQNLYYDIRTADEYARRKRIYHEPDRLDFVPMASAQGPKRIVRDLAREFSRDRFVTVSRFLTQMGALS